MERPTIMRVAESMIFTSVTRYVRVLPVRSFGSQSITFEVVASICQSDPGRSRWRGAKDCLGACAVPCFVFDLVFRCGIRLCTRPTRR